jgi:hypothetical protein
MTSFGIVSIVEKQLELRVVIEIVPKVPLYSIQRNYRFPQP